ncbi:MAG: DEAD/DEAH box helicase [Defluviitaleaceae bacterium]|nr:DEAD/DEAH box helicase [Defluviitaleaceae bacterium]
MRYAVSHSKILGVSANKDTYSRGEKYYREGKIVSFTTKQQKNSTLVKAAVKGNYRNYEVSLTFTMQGDLIGYKCTCASQSIWQGGCKHVIAVLFAISDGRADTTDVNQSNNSEYLTNTLEKLILQEIDDNLNMPAISENSRLAQLSPRFHLSVHGKAYLTFYVGYTRMYTVKNINKFLAAVNRSEVVRYGNGLEFNHAVTSFSTVSRRWIDFLIQEEGVYNEIASQINASSSATVSIRDDTRKIPLSYRNIDTFFDICKNSQIEGDVQFFFENAEQPGLINITSETPQIRFDVTDKSGEIMLSGPKIKYHLLKGHRYSYLLALDTIYRMHKAEAQLLLQILDACAKGSVSFMGYTRKRFISAVMPKLMEMGLLSGFKDRLCPKLKAKMYFDEEDATVTCRTTFSYAEDKEGGEYDAFDTHENDGPRDIAGEYTVKKLLEGLGFVSDFEQKLFRLSGLDKIFYLIGDTPSGLDMLHEYKKVEIYITDKLRNKAAKAGIGSLGVRLRGQILDVYVQDTGFSLSELVESLDSYKAKKKYHQLKDGRMLALTDQLTAEMAESLISLDIERKDLQKEGLSLSLYRAPYIENLISRQNPSFKKLMRQFHAKKSFELPKELQAIMRPYQNMGYQWLKNLVACGFGGILADDMGLGKTLQILALLGSDPLERPALVVAPTSLIYNWAAEIKKFVPKLPFVVVTGSPESRSVLLKNETAKIFITTYDAMKRDIHIYSDLYYKYIIADEAQNIKNPTTKNARIIKSIRADHRIALTGTPIENTLVELWSLFDFVMPGYLYSASKFAKLYEIPIIKDNDRSRIARLREQISPFVLRRLKSTVLSELPPKTETTLVAEMLPEQQKIYTAHLLKAKGELKALLNKTSQKGSKLQILAQLTRLRQICCHPELCIENYTGGSGKLNLAVETLEIAIESGHRVLLFSQFTEMLAILKKTLDAAGIAYFYLDGATSAADRIKQVDRFNSGEKDVFLISLKAGGTGLNLTGADIVIHYDPWWNPSVMDQASDRVHRIGQNKAVQVFNLIAMQTLEERIMELQAKKRKLIDSVLTDNVTGELHTLTYEEIESLLED